MTNDVVSLEEYLDHKPHINKNGITILKVTNEEICVSAYWYSVKQPGIYVDLIYESRSIKEFINTFCTHSIKQLEAITLPTLLNLYYTGKAEVYGAIETPEVFYSLSFKKRGKKLLIFNEESIDYEVGVELSTPEHFVNYIKYHFEFIMNDSAQGYLN